MKTLIALAVFAACCSGAQAGKIPGCVPPMLGKILPASVVASMPGTATTAAPVRFSSTAGQAVYWRCKMPDGKVTTPAYYAAKYAWDHEHERNNAIYRLIMNFDLFMARLDGPACWSAEAINSKDAQIKQLCAELRAEVAALPPVK